MRPRFLVENFFNDVAYPAHLVSASSSAPGADPWRVGTGRRSARDRWTPSATNAEAWIQVACRTPRAADTLVLDRGHNLAGLQVVLESSDDAIAWTERLSVVLPVAPAPATLAAGCVSAEGAFLQRFGEAAAEYWRIRVPAMGADLRPSVVGIWLGSSWQPDLYLDLPYAPESRDLRWAESATDAGWVGRGQATAARVGELGLKLSGTAELETARHHLELWWTPRPMWILHDEDDAYRAVLAMPQSGRVGLEQREGWGWRQASVAWIEHEPRLR